MHIGREYAKQRRGQAPSFANFLFSHPWLSQNTASLSAPESVQVYKTSGASPCRSVSGGTVRSVCTV